MKADGKKKHIFIIAEAGVNHNGEIELAKRMVLEAKKAGADAVKFQTFITEQVISEYAPKAEYQKRETGTGESQKAMVKHFELSFEEFRVLKKLADKIGIIFLSTPFDFESIDFLNSLEIPCWKIPSGEITNKPYLEKIARTGKTVIMSTGMCLMEEINDAMQVLEENGMCQQDITLLHCTTEYPAPLKDINLKAMLALKEKFQTKVGYSDHTLGIEVPIAAVAMGAEVIEKHFTLDKNLKGPDHKASLMPDELSLMVKYIRNVEVAIGNGIKRPTESELKNKVAARKSIVAKKGIKQGEKFTADNITVKRPGNGISPMMWNELLGTYASRDYKADEIVDLVDF